jgi:hypothetical protein
MVSNIQKEKAELFLKYHQDKEILRSEERRVGKECDR